MNLAGVKLDKQDDEAFHLRDDSGPFKVYKKATSKQLLDAIHQHFYDGGEVKKKTQDDELAALAAGNHAALSNGLGNTNPYLVQSGQDPDLAALAKNNSDSLSRASFDGGATLAPPPLGPEADRRLSNILAMHQPTGTTAPPQPQGPMAGQPSPMAPQPPPVPQPRPQGMGGSSLVSDKEIGAAYKQQQDAAMEMARVAGMKAQQDSMAQQQLQKAQEEEHARALEQLKSVNAQQDKARADIAASKIDPEGAWHSKNAGKKTASIISLILGGLAQAFLHSNNNVGLDMLEQQSRDDIEAQKANLGKKQSYLSDLVARGYSIQEAEKLAQAHHYAIYQGMLLKNAADLGTPQAMAAAQKESGELQAKRLATIDQVHQQRFQNAIEMRRLGIEAAAKGLGRPLMEQDVGKLAAQKDAPEVLKKIADAQADVGLSGLVGAVTPESLHFGAQRRLDNVINASAGPLAIAQFPLAKSESPELTHMVKELMPKGYQSAEAAREKLRIMEENAVRANRTKLAGLAAGGSNPAEIAALRAQPMLGSTRVPVIGPDGKRYSVDESEVQALPKGFRRAD